MFSDGKNVCLQMRQTRREVAGCRALVGYRFDKRCGRVLLLARRFVLNGLSGGVRVKAAVVCIRRRFRFTFALVAVREGQWWCSVWPPAS